MSGTAISEARALLVAAGWHIMREKSYRQAVQRWRVADAMREYAEELRAGSDRWAREDLCPEIRRLRDRLTFVYGVARAHGATLEELRSGEDVQ